MTKLSDKLQESRNNAARHIPSLKTIEAVKQLEQDSEMLNDLIEMMTDIKLTQIRQKNGEWLIAIYEIEGALSRGSTPKEAIQQAIAKWKEGRK
jgi:hypothetical protein